MIDIEREKLIGLAEAARYVPCRRGKKTAATTLWRWIAEGKRGVRLEALRSPSGWLTSVKAVQRFLAAQAGHDDRGRDELRRAWEAAARREAERDWAAAFWEARGVTCGGGIDG